MLNKKTKCFLLIVICICSIFYTDTNIIYAKEKWPSMPSDVKSPSIIVMDTTTSSVLLGKNIDEKLYPASITKVLTTICAIENSSKDLNETVTISKKSMDYNYENGGQYLPGAKENTKLSMKSALQAVMLRSANEVAWSVGESISGSNDKYCDLMNKRAKEIGCKTTHFSNPNGLHEDDHYTSVYDMALISSLAINNKTFKDLIKNKSAKIPETDFTVVSNHRLHDNPSSKWCVGGKTGFTTEARHSLVTFAKKDNRNLVCVVMNASSGKEAAEDSKAAIEYCFDKFKCINISKKENKNLQESFKEIAKDYEENIIDYSDKVNVEDDKTVHIPKEASYSDLKKEVTFDKDISLEIGKNKIGKIKYYYDDKKIATCDICLDYPNHNITPLPLPKEADDDLKSNRFLHGFNAKTIITISCIILFLLVLIYNKTDMKKYSPKYINCGKNKLINIKNKLLCFTKRFLTNTKKTFYRTIKNKE